MLKFTILLLALVACVVNAKKPKDDTVHLDGENPVNIDRVPYTVSIQQKGAHVCNGAIYDSLTILATAECLQKLKGSTIKVRAGSTYWNSGGVLETAKSFKIHEAYDRKSKNNNIAVLRLSNYLPINLFIRPLSLARKSVYHDDIAYISGWKVPGKSLKKMPKSVQFRGSVALSNTQCDSLAYGYGNEVKHGMICARDIDSCMFSDGAPMAINNTLSGIASFSNDCNNQLYPEVFTDLATYRNWIVQYAHSN